MFIKRQFYFGLWFAIFAVVSVWAQTPATDQTRAQSPEINIIINQHLVRFAAPSDIPEWRLEVANQQGEVIFDSGSVSGTALEWPLRNQQGEALEGGLYAYTLTIKD